MVDVDQRMSGPYSSVFISQAETSNGSGDLVRRAPNAQDQKVRQREETSSALMWHPLLIGLRRRWVHSLYPGVER